MKPLFALRWFTSLPLPELRQEIAQLYQIIEELKQRIEVLEAETS